MKLSKGLQALKQRTALGDDYWIERTKLDFSLSLERQRRRIGISYADLAKKLGTSAPYISKVFRGDANVTIETMVKLARAAGGRVNIQIADERTDAKTWANHRLANFGRPAANEPVRTGNVYAFTPSAPNNDEKIAA